MKRVFGLPALLMCFGLMSVQPVYAVKNPSDSLKECRKKVEQLEKEKQKQTTPAEKVRAPEEKTNQTAQPNAQPKFAPYSHP